MSIGLYSMVDGVKRNRMVDGVNDEREVLAEYDRKWHRKVGEKPCFTA